MKLNISTSTCPQNMWARQLNGRGTRSKRLVSCVLASLIKMVTALPRKVLDLNYYLQNVYTRQQNKRV
jgi:hypothetical protein